MSQAHFQTYSELFNPMLITPYFPNPDLLIYFQSNYHQLIHTIKQPDPHIQINTHPQYSQKLFKPYHNSINTFNPSPVLPLNINHYHLHNHPHSLNPIIQKIPHLIKIYTQTHPT
ncbi:deoxynucleoside kinase [Staphylococcus pasteuri]|uniref:deoxynucleoside kinase n=1 Tax=Staphylococcus pasteuri TaxID=45972 RepID=UPI0021BFD574|nr:deoxynucleoside kinase [Staphylococcus pasteuri]